MQLPGRVVFGPLGRYLSRRWLSAGILAMQGGAVLLLVGEPSFRRLIVFVVLFGMANGIVTLAWATTVAEHCGTAHYSRINGLMAFRITLARAAGPTARRRWRHCTQPPRGTLNWRSCLWPGRWGRGDYLLLRRAAGYTPAIIACR